MSEWREKDWGRIAIESGMYRHAEGGGGLGGEATLFRTAWRGRAGRRSIAGKEGVRGEGEAFPAIAGGS